MKRRHYLLVATVTYLVALLATVPADLAYRWAVDMLPMLSKTAVLDGIEGTLWHGHARRLRLAGMEVRVDGLDWRLHPLALVTGDVHVGIEGAWAGARIGAEIRLPITSLAGPLGRLHLSDVLIEAPLDAPALASRLPWPASGRLRITLAKAVVVTGQDRRTLPIERIEGRAVVDELSLAMTRPLELGRIVLALETDDAGRIVGSLAGDTRGPLGIEGEIRVHEDGDQYGLDVTLTLRDRSRGDLLQSLSLLGTPGPDGRLRIAYQGRLSQDLAWLTVAAPSTTGTD